MRSIFYYESLKSGFFNPYPDLLKGTALEVWIFWIHVPFLDFSKKKLKSVFRVKNLNLDFAKTHH